LPSAAARSAAANRNTRQPANSARLWPALRPQHRSFAARDSERQDAPHAPKECADFKPSLAVAARASWSASARRAFRSKLGVDAAIARATELGAEVVLPPHRNPPSGDGGPNHRECWLGDLDGYTVVLASPKAKRPGTRPLIRPHAPTEQRHVRSSHAAVIVRISLFEQLRSICRYVASL
jgi:hypothetical protein